MTEVVAQPAVSQAERALLVGFSTPPRQSVLSLTSIRLALTFLDGLPPIYHRHWLAAEINDPSRGAAIGKEQYRRAITELTHQRPRGDRESALRELAVDHEDAAASFTLALLLATRGRPEEAAAWLHRAAELGHAFAAIVLGLTMSADGFPADAQQWFRRAAETEVVLGRELLLAEEQEQRGGLRALQRETQARPQSSAAVAVGLLAMIRGERPAAEHAMREVASLETTAASALGVLLSERGETEGRRWLWEAASAGDAGSAVLFGSLMRDDPDAAARWLKQSHLGPSWQADPRPLALRISYMSPLTAIVTFTRSLVSLTAWLDGLAALIALLGNFDDRVATHRNRIALDRVQAEEAVVQARRDNETSRLQAELKQAELRLALVSVGTLEELLPQARQLAGGEFPEVQA